MLDHISIGVRDIERSRRFYDSVLAPLGYSRKMDVGATSGYGGDTPVYWIALAERPVPSDSESACTFALPRRRAKASMPSMPRRAPQAAATTASPACARITAPIITRPLPSIPTAIGSKPIAAARYRACPDKTGRRSAVAPKADQRGAAKMSVKCQMATIRRLLAATTKDSIDL